MGLIITEFNNLKVIYLWMHLFFGVCFLNLISLSFFLKKRNILEKFIYVNSFMSQVFQSSHDFFLMPHFCHSIILNKFLPFWILKPFDVDEIDLKGFDCFPLNIIYTIKKWKILRKTNYVLCTTVTLMINLQQGITKSITKIFIYIYKNLEQPS